MDDCESLQLALEFAKAKHKGQKRIGGDEYITHPIAVCEIVKSNGLDESYQIAALMAQIAGWERTSSIKRLPIYGRQRLYHYGG